LHFSYLNVMGCLCVYSCVGRIAGREWLQAVSGESRQQTVAVGGMRFAWERRLRQRLTGVGEEPLKACRDREHEKARFVGPGDLEGVAGAAWDRHRIAAARGEPVAAGVVVNFKSQFAVKDVEALAPRVQVEPGTASGRGRCLYERELVIRFVAAEQAARQVGPEHQVVRASTRGVVSGSRHEAFLSS
jgi:hypothetical protein